MESKSQLHLLGTFQFIVDGEPVTAFRSDKVRALLAWLAIESDRSHQRQILATLLWGEYPNSMALKNLRMSISNLKKMLTGAGLEELLTITRNQLELTAKDLLHCDALELQRLIAEVSAHPHPNGRPCNTCLPKLEEAVALYRGEFMAGLSVAEADEFAQWQNIQRELMNNSVNRALDMLIDAAERAQAEPRVQQFVNRQLALTPWHEMAHRALMRSLAREGRHDAALAQYESCEKVLWDELGVSPSAETVALRDQLIAEMQEAVTTRPPQPAQPRHNLPRLLPAFFGRNAERIQLTRHLLDPDFPLVTLVGEGGIGKTHLSLTVAADLLSKLDSVWFVELEHVPLNSTVDQSILKAIATAMQIDLGNTVDPLAELAVWLQQKRLLLILDNIEHLANSKCVQRLFERLLNRIRGLTILTTSRQPLRMRVEYSQRLYGLPVPKSAELAAGRSSIQLFAERARRASGYELKPDDLSHIVAICRLVEGIPLAIELAAGWTTYMQVGTIAETLQHDIGQLESAMVDVPDRHRSLQSVFDSSWMLLPATEQRVLSALAIFQGGFTREAAQAVAGAKGWTLASLVDKSLLRRSTDQSKLLDRYIQPIVVRRYAVERLNQNPDLSTTVAMTHARFYLQQLVTYRVELKFNSKPDIGHQLMADIDNLRCAWHWHIDHAEWATLHEALLPLFYLIDTRSYYREGRDLFGALVDRLSKVDSAEYDVLYAQALARLGWFTFQLGQLQRGREHLGQALSLFERMGNSAETVFCFNYLSAIAMHTGAYKEAQHAVQIARERAVAVDDHLGMITASNILGRVAWFNTDFPTATRHYTEALSLARQKKHVWSITFSLEYLGQIAFTQREYVEAMRLYQESLDFRLQLDDQRGIGLCSNKMADAAVQLNDIAKAQALYGRALETFERIGNLLGILNTHNRLGGLKLVQDESAAARVHFMHVLQFSHSSQAQQATLAAINGMAHVLMLEGKRTQALSLWAWLRHQELPQLRDEVQLHWEAVSAEMPPTQRATIEQHHQGQTTQQVAAGIW